MRLMKIIVAGAIAGISFPSCSSASACPELSRVVNRSADASQALMDCIGRTPAGGQLDLPPGRLLLTHRIWISKPIKIATAGLSEGDAPCGALETRCATLVVDADSSSHPTSFPIDVNSGGVSLTHLIIEGSNDPRIVADCGGPPERRVYVGALRIQGSDFVLRKSVLRNFACHTAMQVRAGYKNLTIENNLIGPNGNHSIKNMWSDGVTVHDSEYAVVRNNRFIDNTDVQLIFGGCRNCSIEGNLFRHNDSFSGASFAELMLNTFPGTSGNFDGSRISGNRIDCGAAKRCGYGIMVGASPWRSSTGSSRAGGMSGGTVARNFVRNAAIAINVDAPTGPVQISANRVTSSGATRASDCGEHPWPAVNVAPDAIRFVKGNPANVPEGHVSTIGCLINRSPR